MGGDLLDRWAGGPGQLLDGRVPWPRDGIEAVTACQDVISVLRAVERGATIAGDHAAQVQRAQGTWACAAWTLGLPWYDRRCLAPVTRRAARVSADTLEEELQAAGDAVELRASGWQRCAGIIAWIAWATGAPDARYPTAGLDLVGHSLSTAAV